MLLDTILNPFTNTGEHTNRHVLKPRVFAASRRLRPDFQTMVRTPFMTQKIIAISKVLRWSAAQVLHFSIFWECPSDQNIQYGLLANGNHNNRNNSLLPYSRAGWLENHEISIHDLSLLSSGCSTQSLKGMPASVRKAQFYRRCKTVGASCPK